MWLPAVPREKLLSKSDDAAQSSDCFVNMQIVAIAHAMNADFLKPLTVLLLSRDRPLWVETGRWTGQTRLSVQFFPNPVCAPKSLDLVRV